jgi:BirA family biotin operon repressor/biotin-[acetyl-CoA-carboxylase] ligase
LRFVIHEYEEIGSTIDEIKSLLEQGAGEGTVVRADRQTAGRGRRGRRWISETGNLYCSLILAPECPLIQATQLSFVMAIAVGEAIIPYLKAPEVLSYKWPNDLLLNRKKVAGILIETESDGGDLAHTCVASVGVNLQSVPHNPDYPVTALSQHSDRDVSCGVLLPVLLEHINIYYQLWREQGFDSIRQKWLERGHAFNQEMAIMVGNTKHNGKYKGLSAEGALLIEGEDGLMHELTSAEVW